MLTAPGPERVLRTQEKAWSGMPGRQDVCDDAALWSPLVSGTNVRDAVRNVTNQPMLVRNFHPGKFLIRRPSLRKVK